MGFLNLPSPEQQGKKDAFVTLTSSQYRDYFRLRFGGTTVMNDGAAKSVLQRVRNVASAAFLPWAINFPHASVSADSTTAQTVIPKHLLVCPTGNLPDDVDNTVISTTVDLAYPTLVTPGMSSFQTRWDKIRVEERTYDFEFVNHDYGDMIIGVQVLPKYAALNPNDYLTCSEYGMPQPTYRPGDGAKPLEELLNQPMVRYKTAKGAKRVNVGVPAYTVSEETYLDRQTDLSGDAVTGYQQMPAVPTRTKLSITINPEKVLRAFTKEHDAIGALHLSDYSALFDSSAEPAAAGDLVLFFFAVPKDMNTRLFNGSFLESDDAFHGITMENWYGGTASTTVRALEWTGRCMVNCEITTRFRLHDPVILKPATTVRADVVTT